MVRKWGNHWGPCSRVEKKAFHNATGEVRNGGVEFECQLGCRFRTGWLGQVEHIFSDTFIPKYSAMDEKIGTKIRKTI
jgi:hypothetical protein